MAADIRANPDRRVLYVLERAGPAVVSSAEAGVVDLIAVDRGRVVIGGTDFLEQTPTPQPRPARASWSRWAIERVRILSPTPKRQVDLAQAIGVTQQAIAKATKKMPATSPSIAQWRTRYPGAGGLKSYWYHLDPIATQGEAALAALDELDVRGLLTGDLAADEWAPWRLPVYAHVYSSELVDLTPWGFVPADQSESTLMLQVPDDPTIWATAAWYANGSRADPLIAMWDLAHAPGPDADEAAVRLGAAIAENTHRA